MQLLATLAIDKAHMYCRNYVEIEQNIVKIAESMLDCGKDQAMRFSAVAAATG